VSYNPGFLFQTPLELLQHPARYNRVVLFQTLLELLEETNVLHHSGFFPKVI